MHILRTPGERFEGLPDFRYEPRYADVPDVWVGGNLFLCYERGNPAAIVAPDVLLAKGVTKWDRPNYLLWEETVPSLMVEVTSRKTRREDQGKSETGPAGQPRTKIPRMCHAPPRK